MSAKRQGSVFYTNALVVQALQKIVEEVASCLVQFEHKNDALPEQTVKHQESGIVYPSLSEILTSILSKWCNPSYAWDKKQIHKSLNDKISERFGKSTHSRRIVPDCSRNAYSKVGYPDDFTSQVFSSANDAHWAAVGMTSQEHRANAMEFMEKHCNAWSDYIRGKELKKAGPGAGHKRAVKEKKRKNAKEAESTTSEGAAAAGSTKSNGNKRRKRQEKEHVTVPEHIAKFSNLVHSTQGVTPCQPLSENVCRGDSCLHCKNVASKELREQVIESLRDRKELREELDKICSERDSLQREIARLTELLGAKTLLEIQNGSGDDDDHDHNAHLPP